MMDDFDMISGIGAGVPSTGSPGPGVVFTPPHLIADSIKAQVDALLGTVPPDKRLVVVTVLTRAGANAAIAYRPFESDHLVVGAWVGKTGWTQAPLEGGVFVKAAL